MYSFTRIRRRAYFIIQGGKNNQSKSPSLGCYVVHVVDPRAFICDRGANNLKKSRTTMKKVTKFEKSHTKRDKKVIEKVKKSQKKS